MKITIKSKELELVFDDEYNGDYCSPYTSNSFTIIDIICKIIQKMSEETIKLREAE